MPSPSTRSSLGKWRLNEPAEPGQVRLLGIPESPKKRTPLSPTGGEDSGEGDFRSIRFRSEATLGRQLQYHEFFVEVIPVNE